MCRDRGHVLVTCPHLSVEKDDRALNKSTRIFGLVHLLSRRRRYTVSEMAGKLKMKWAS
jgi:hypothetical protein